MFVLQACYAMSTGNRSGGSKFSGQHFQLQVVLCLFCCTTLPEIKKMKKKYLFITVALLLTSGPQQVN